MIWGSLPCSSPCSPGLKPACMILQQNVLEGWLGHNHAILQTLRAGKDDEVLLEQSEADAAAGFCTPPLTHQQLQAVLQQRPYRLIPRCIIVQSSGKKRIIDNADSGGQSERSQDSNKLVLCTPLGRRRVAAVMRHMTAAQMAEAREDGWESGGEDWPNAYRHSPMGDEESLACVVAFFHHQWGFPAFQVYGGLLFGLPLAITSFNRFSRLVESLARCGGTRRSGNLSV